MKNGKSVIIIGAGLGGLSAACRLAKLGFSVKVLEKNATVGGKVNSIESGGYKFDTGASLLTMRHVFDELFEFCDRKLSDYLTLKKLDPICRYFWEDGIKFDASDDLLKTEAQIFDLEKEDISNFRRYLADSKQKYEISERTFLSKSLNDLPSLIRPTYLPDLLKISSLNTLSNHNRSYFKSKKLQQLFDRFATYNGSSPYKTPATFALIPYVEFGLGAWYVDGGIYQIPKALEKLSLELGVESLLDCEVEKINVIDGKATGVNLRNGEKLESDFVVSNADAIETYRNLLPKPKYQNREPSCSGFVLLIGVKKRFPMLAHHNIFFSNDYKAEFDVIFGQKLPANDPTIYICATSRTDDSQAPKDSENLFILINAPYTNSNVDWKTTAEGYRDQIVKKLEKLGLEDLEASIEFEQIITPEDFETKYRANKGSIYGMSSNGIFSAFMRVPNRATDVKDLYFVGGVTHPGGGMPLVLLSAKMAADMLSKLI